MNKSFFRKSSTHMIVTLGLLLAMEVILSRFFSIQTPFVKISFSFAPLSLGAILYGPFAGAAMGAAADFIGATLFPAGSFFPGYTLTALLTGLVYGLFLYKKVTLTRIILAVSIIAVFLHLGLNTLWIYMTSDKAYIALLIPRIAKELVMVPIQTAVIYLLSTRILSLQTE